MPGELLTKYLMEKLIQEQPEIKIQNDESIEEEKARKAEAFKLKALEITTNLNNAKKLEITEDF